MNTRFEMKGRFDLLQMHPFRAKEIAAHHTHRMKKLDRNEVGLVAPRKTHQPDQQLRVLFVECVAELH